MRPACRSFRPSFGSTMWRGGSCGTRCASRFAGRAPTNPSDRAACMIRGQEQEDAMKNSDEHKENKVDRRSFLQAAGAVAGSALASSALSYGRIVGANDRIAVGHIGIGNRGSQ